MHRDFERALLRGIEQYMTATCKEQKSELF